MDEIDLNAVLDWADSIVEDTTEEDNAIEWRIAHAIKSENSKILDENS